MSAVTPPASAPPRSRPGIVYHYATLQGAYGLVTNRCLWATNLRYLADSAEFVHAYRQVRHALWERSRDRGPDMIRIIDTLLERDWTDDRVNEAISLMGADLAVYSVSFSEIPDLLSQWRAYCPGGGYSFGFRFDALEALANHYQMDLIRCEYDSAKQKAEAATIADNFMNELETNLGHDLLHTFFNTYYNKAEQHLGERRHNLMVATLDAAPKWKHESFEEETEWRLVSRPSGAPAVRPPSPLARKFRVGRTALIPYAELKFDIPTLCNAGKCNALGEVVVGPCPDQPLALASIRALMMDSKVAEPELRRSNTPYRHW